MRTKGSNYSEKPQQSQVALGGRMQPRQGATKMSTSGMTDLITPGAGNTGEFSDTPSQLHVFVSGVEIF